MLWRTREAETLDRLTMKHVVLGTKVLVRAEVASRTAHLFPNNSMSRPANGHQGHVEDLICALEVSVPR